MKDYEKLKLIDVDITGYTTIHFWLVREYGNGKKCQLCGVPQNNTTKDGRSNLQWALLKNKEHERKRENYMSLCVPCHNKYDKRTPELCTIKECDKPYMGAGYCRRHYSRQYYRTNLAKTKRTNKTYDSI